MSDMITLTIDGQNVTAPAGSTILEAAKLVGIDIPTLCHHPLLRPEGACRVCVCKVTGARAFLPACIAKATDGMEVFTHDPEVLEARKNIELKFRGSANQRVLDVPASLAAKAAVWCEKYR